MNEETSVKELLNDLCDVLGEIALLEEGKTYEAKVTDCFGTRIVNESAIERARSLSNIALESYVMQIQEILGYEDK
ncbi:MULTISPECIES: hypothetical protein [Vagococcus]|uniref:Phage protein n=1 Tax=Vagococcus fluvialis bH819 TaxID=1255619 RepID=A0A1X6WQL6_9ENTE|nr:MULTISPECIES: hypothetical protein [Vagococcus]SLM86548.1 hypothetical protein FM121_10675 [Vagococcus fluvialis bH819]HCM90755.1 hypothetical protein [Vagococcus sp.]